MVLFLFLLSTIADVASSLDWTNGNVYMPMASGYGGYTTIENEKLFIFSGQYDDPSIWSESIMIYDIKTRFVWSTITTQSPKLYCPHSCAVSISNSSWIYIINPGLSYGTIYIFDTSTLQFVTNEVGYSAMPYEVSRGASCINPNTNMIYIVGGYLANGAITNYFQIYDVNNDNWSSASSYPINIAYSSCIYHNGYIYHFGGRKQSGDPNIYDDQIYRYNINDNMWEYVTSYISGPRGYHRLIVHNLNIYSLGGYNELYNSSETFYNDVHILDTITLNITLNVLYSNRNVNEGGCGQYVTMMDHRILVFGGENWLEQLENNLIISDILPTVTMDPTIIPTTIPTVIPSFTPTNNPTIDEHNDRDNIRVLDIILISVVLILSIIVIWLLFILRGYKQSKSATNKIKIELSEANNDINTNMENEQYKESDHIIMKPFNVEAEGQEKQIPKIKTVHSLDSDKNNDNNTDDEDLYTVQTTTGQ